jgi:hypothetical protein
MTTAALRAALAGISTYAPLALTGTDAARFPLAAFLAVILGTGVTCVASRLMPGLVART